MVAGMIHTAFPEETISFRVSDATGLVLSDVVNYPNPFSGETHFTFQAQPSSDASLVDVEIKVYTISGRLIRKLDGLILQQPGYNYYHWDGRDEGHKNGPVFRSAIKGSRKHFAWSHWF